ncbi:MAG: VIT domain-containing protein [Anaerolineaceae bacterium]|nr:VIT domain-containing protein [Anaerolineaceae bacterium]
MSSRLLFACLAAITLLLSPFQTVLADGIIIPEPPPCAWEDCPPALPRPISQLEIRYHHVSVEIEDQVAVTHVDQVFYNPNDWQVEGTYIFPLPQDAAVSDFTLWIDNEPVKGTVLDAGQARQIYEEIVQDLRDPALLEYVGRGAVQANIFPIPAGEERRIELEYSQVLEAENGLVRYVYPLNTEKFSAQPLQEARIDVQIRSTAAIRAVYSPTHAIDLVHQGETRAEAHYQESDVLPDSDFALYYSLGESQAAHLFSYRDPDDPQDPDGYFLLLLAPQLSSDRQVSGKDLLLVLDRSGSMEGEKFSQAQSALDYILGHLNPDDRFYLSAFSSGVDVFSEGLSPAGQADQARQWVDQRWAEGSTDINRVLLEAAAVADPQRPTYLIFLTDGLPTEGVVDSGLILDQFQQSAPDNLRLFAFGVGYDVDTFLLDSLTQDHHGLSTYVRPGDALDESLSSFYARVSTPLMTDLELDFGVAAVYDVYPQILPDLFAGSQIVVTGRYRRGGPVDLTLGGKSNGETQTILFRDLALATDSREAADERSAIPRLWATRKIGHLLNKIRLDGPDAETVQQIVAISIRFGIVTPYTSYLVTEADPLGAANQERMAQEAYQELEAMPAQPAYGQEAVEKAADQGALSQADTAASVPEGDEQGVRIAGGHTFLLQDGVWTDTLYDPDHMQAIRVQFLSREYFDLAASRPDVAAAMSLGVEVIVVVDGQAYHSLEVN